MAAHYERLTQFQRLLFKHHASMRELALANCGTLQKRSMLKAALEALPEEELSTLVIRQLRCVRPSLKYCFTRARPLPSTLLVLRIALLHAGLAAFSLANIHAQGVDRQRRPPP